MRGEFARFGALVVSLAVASCADTVNPVDQRGDPADASADTIVDEAATGDASIDDSTLASDVVVDSAPPDASSVDASVDAECREGATSTSACGRCGTMTRTCTGGTWSPFGACSGEGECAPGDTQSKSCPGGAADSTRTCSGACAWGAFSDCGATLCSPGAIDTQACGRCGTKSRTCASDGSTFGAFGPCSGEGECAAGDRRDVRCGRCGTESDVCSSTCSWTLGACSGEGECTAGATETSASACGGAGGTRTCSSTCAWGAYACGGSCGRVGQACCSGTTSTCASGAACWPMGCVSCGHAGEACCDGTGASRCIDGSSCATLAGEARCYVAGFGGNPGENCFSKPCRVASNVCDGGYCLVCGGFGQPCCAGASACSAPYKCTSGTCG